MNGLLGFSGHTRKKSHDAYDNIKLKQHLTENITPSEVFTIPWITQKCVKKELRSPDLTKAAGLDTVTSKLLIIAAPCFPVQLRKYTIWVSGLVSFHIVSNYVENLKGVCIDT